MAKPNSDNAGSSDGRFYDATAKFFITFPFPTKNVLCVMIPIEKIVPYPDNYYGVGGDADGQEYEGNGQALCIAVAECVACGDNDAENQRNSHADEISAQGKRVGCRKQT